MAKRSTLSVSNNLAHNFTLPQVKLPELNFPNFRGEYDQWLSFSENYTSLIHNNANLSNVQKYHYLKSCLKGDAAKLIECLSISAENYDIAWQLLIETYQNNRLIIKTHINAVFNFPTTNKRTASSIRGLIDFFAAQLKIFKNLGLSADYWAILIIHILINKLDFNTIKEWEGIQ